MAAGVQFARGALKGKEADPEAARERPEEDLGNRDRSFLPNRRCHPGTGNKVDCDDEEKKRRSETVSREDDTDEDSEARTGRIREIAVRSVSGVERTKATEGLPSPTGMGGNPMRCLTDTRAKRTILRKMEPPHRELIEAIEKEFRHIR